MKPSFLHSYKPTDLSDFHMSDTMIQLLRTLIDKDELSILILGTPGVGKTSLLQVILTLYYKDYPKDNILYINKLKEQGYQQYRYDLKVFCQTTSSIKGKNKSLVVDDIDLLPDNIQQIIVHCMNQYKHVNFLFTGTYSSKIIQSIQSRIFCIHMPSWTPSSLSIIVKHILKNEDIQVEEEAFELLNQSSSLKIALHTLEKCYFLHQPITVSLLRSTHIPWNTLEGYVKSILSNSLSTASKLIYGLYEEGYPVIDILDHLYIFIRSYPLHDSIRYEWVKHLCIYIVQFNQVHEHAIELIFLTHDLYNTVETVSKTQVCND